MKTKKILISILSYFIMVITFVCYSMSKDRIVNKTPCGVVLDDRIKARKCFEGYEDINVYLILFILAALIICVMTIISFKNSGKKSLDFILIALSYCLINMSLMIWSAIYFLTSPFPYYTFDSTLFHLNLIIGMVCFIFSCIFIKKTYK